MEDQREFMQRSRYKYAFDISIEKGYESISIMDADLMILSPNIINLFKAVEKNNLMVTSNETLKWIIDDKYLSNNFPVFKNNKRLYKFHCNAPTFFNPSKWKDVYEKLEILLNDCFEVTDENFMMNYNDKKVKTVCDLFCWNIAIYQAGRENDVILMSQDILTQVGYSLSSEDGYLVKEDGIWRTGKGQEVFSFHGKIKDPRWFEDYQKKIVEKTGKKKMKDLNMFYLKNKNILCEWKYFCYEHKIDFSKYEEKDV